MGCRTIFTGLFLIHFAAQVDRRFAQNIATPRFDSVYRAGGEDQHLVFRVLHSDWANGELAFAFR